MECEKKRCARQAVLQAKSVEAGADMPAVWESAVACPQIAERDAFVLLQRIFLENHELDGAGGFRQSRAQPTGAVHNPHEPEAQWRSKSTTRDKAWMGCKVQVAETVQDEPRETGEPTARSARYADLRNDGRATVPSLARHPLLQRNPTLTVQGLSSV